MFHMPRKPTDEGSCPTTYEYLLYLLIEIERLIERRCINWTPDRADAILRRMTRIAEKVVLASKQHNPDRPN